MFGAIFLRERGAWNTIKQETGNCHLYEKYGFVRVGEDIVVNEKMTLVGYVKINCTPCQGHFELV